MCAIIYKEYVLALLLCWNICTSISPTSTHQPKTHATHTHTHLHIYIYMCVCVCMCAHACTHTYSRSANKNRRHWCIVYIWLFNQDIINTTFYLTCGGAVKLHHCKKDNWIKSEKHKFIYVLLVIKCMNYWIPKYL